MVVKLNGKNPILDDYFLIGELETKLELNKSKYDEYEKLLNLKENNNSKEIIKNNVKVSVYMP